MYLFQVDIVSVLLVYKSEWWHRFLNKHPRSRTNQDKPKKIGTVAPIQLEADMYFKNYAW